MAYILPNSLSVAPQTPDTQTSLTFTVQGTYDYIDYLSALGFNTVIYVLYKPSNQSTWKSLTSWNCNGCYDTIAGGFSANLTMAIASNPVPDGVGTYDFMAIDQGDYIGKSAPYPSTRTATLYGVYIKPYHPAGQPSVTVTSMQGATITVNGNKSTNGTNTQYGDSGTPYNIKVTAYGYSVYTKSGVFGTGDTPIYAQLDPCDVTTDSACFGYAGAGGSGTTTPCSTTNQCLNGESCTNGVCTVGSTTCSSTDYICQLTPYWTYIAAGAVVLLLMMSSPGSSGGGGSRQPIIIERGS
jgi:hypothetical protein